MSNRIPPKIVTDAIERGKGMQVFGVALHDMTRDELICAAVMGWEAERRAREDEQMVYRSMQALAR